MPEIWTLTPTAENPKEFYDLLLSVGGNICDVRPHERRGEMNGVFAIIVEGKTDDERADIRWKLKRLGLRCITDQERQVLAQGILLPRETTLLPESSAPLPSLADSLDTDALQRLEGEGGIVQE